MVYSFLLYFTLINIPCLITLLNIILNIITIALIEYFNTLI